MVLGIFVFAEAHAVSNYGARGRARTTGLCRDHLCRTKFKKRKWTKFHPSNLKIGTKTNEMATKTRSKIFFSHFLISKITLMIEIENVIIEIEQK